MTCACVLCDLLGAGWHMHGSSFKRPGCEREFRVVLTNRELGKKLFGFGATFAEAVSVARAQT